MTDLEKAKERIAELEDGRVEFENLLMGSVAMLTRGEGEKLRRSEARVVDLEKALRQKDWDFAEEQSLRIGVEENNEKQRAKVAALEGAFIIRKHSGQCHSIAPVHEDGDRGQNYFDDTVNETAEFECNSPEGEARLRILWRELYSNLGRKVAFSIRICNLLGDEMLSSEIVVPPSGVQSFSFKAGGKLFLTITRLASVSDDTAVGDIALDMPTLEMKSLKGEASALRQPYCQTVDIVFDGPPGHESGRFVEVENLKRESINLGKWIERNDGYWVLRIQVVRDETDQSD